MATSKPRICLACSNVIGLISTLFGVNSFGSLILAADDLAGTRLISMLTDVIVPENILSGLDGPAYNFHPGPPEYPGSHAASFAVYYDADGFGVTLHEMAAQVDSGPIIEVRRYDMPPTQKVYKCRDDCI